MNHIENIQKLFSKNFVESPLLESFDAGKLEAKITDWKLATTKGQNVKDLAEGEVFGYPVESGMGCFMDYETQKLLNALEQEMFQKKADDFEGIYAEFFHEHFYEQDGAVHQYTLLKPYLDKANNIFAFETGFGEGFYASYIAYDEVHSIDFGAYNRGNQPHIKNETVLATQTKISGGKGSESGSRSQQVRSKEENSEYSYWYGDYVTSAHGKISIIVAPAANNFITTADIDKAEAEIAEADIVLTQLEIPVAVISDMKEVLLKTRDGVNITTHLFQPDEANGKLLLINSATGVKQQVYFAIAQYFAENSFTVITYDYRGIGLSKPLDMRNFNSDAVLWGKEDFGIITAYIKENFSDYQEITACGHFWAEAGHDWFHIERVWRLSKKLAETEKCNTEVVELGALLHDIADPKFHNGDENIGPDTARSFLENQNVDEDYYSAAAFYFSADVHAQTKKSDTITKEKAIEEVVMIGYGSQKKENVTGSIGVVSAKDLADKPNPNPISSIQGKVAGVQIQNSGAPGGSPRVDIRGISSLSGKTVFIVDGMITDDISFLNPQDVESMSILKDPSSLASFGQPLGSYYGYQVAASFPETRLISMQHHSSKCSSREDSDLPKDLDGNGVIDARDKTFLGSPIPKYTYGFGFNLSVYDFDFAMDFQGVQGNKIYNYNREQRYGNENWDLDFYKNRWQGAGTSNSYPMTTNNQAIILPSSFFVEDGSFFRIRNIQLVRKTRGQASNTMDSLQRLMNSDRVQMGIDNNIYPISAIYTFAVVSFLAGCKNDSFLDIPVEGQTEESAFFKTQDDALKATNAIYSFLRGWENSAFPYQFIFGVPADDVIKGSNPGDASFINAYDQFTYTAR
ncbi:hypothetical protein FQR65_LT15289 [Abscondita terminalis]|nr:hypothetical protein FQR65_LT15289 [Abscondita terminalis]